MTAADAVVATWASIAPEDRADLIARLTSAGVVRRCKSGGYSIDLGDGMPTWRPTEEAVERLFFGSRDTY